MVGGGCRGLDLARGLVADGHAVRATTRGEGEAGRERLAALEAAGCEALIADPDVIGTLHRKLDNVTVVLWLLGTADDAPQVHRSRLQFMLERTIDTTVRGFLYEAVGSVEADALAEGRRHVDHARDHHGIPVALVEADPRGPRETWLAAAREAIDELLV